MDSSGFGNEWNKSENILGSPDATSLHQRTEIENSDKITRFVLPSMDGSPPKVLTLNEVAHVVKNIQNMELAHEIALNPEFKLYPYEPPENSLERRIKDVMHRAFWDVLREQLNRTPPCYDQAIQLLNDIKECFPQILSQNNKRALDHINAVLDPTIIRQQAENSVLDFKAYANFIIHIMAKGCAPARDEAVQKLMEIDDIVDTFKGVLETMSLMKLDMVNYLLDYARNDIMANSVEYEKEKFKEYLEYYKFGFPNTENWLRRNCTQDTNNVLSTPDQTISNAYMELMDWNLAIGFPEVLTIDKERILKLGQRSKRLCASASIISVCMALPIISLRPVNRKALAEQIGIILRETMNNTEIEQIVQNVWLQAKTVINEYLLKEDQPLLDESTQKQLKAHIFQVANPSSPVRILMWKRLQSYFLIMLRSKTGIPPPPPGYGDYEDELKTIVVSLKRIISYNHSVFGDYFREILTQQRPENDECTVAGITTL